MTMSRVMSSLPVDREMKAALLGKKNSLSIALEFVRCHEIGDWKAHEDIRQALGISDDTASRLYVGALKWADETSHAFDA